MPLVSYKEKEEHKAKTKKLIDVLEELHFVITHGGGMRLLVDYLALQLLHLIYHHH